MKHKLTLLYSDTLRIAGVAVLIIAAAAAILFGTSSQHSPARAEINGFVLDRTVPHQINLAHVTVYGSRGDIPAIDEPLFSAIHEVGEISDNTKGILIEHAGEQRFYPHSILAWHEVVNDSFGNDMIAVIFCPRTETSAAFYRQAGDTTLRFGVSGLRYDATSLLYDHGTETLWLGIRGLGAVGELSGVQLQEVKMQTLDAGTVRERYPLATTLTTDIGFDRNYQINPFKEEL